MPKKSKKKPCKMCKNLDLNTVFGKIKHSGLGQSRNGLDNGPPDDQDWQMSPFSNERYELDELQKAEKKGYKRDSPQEKSQSEEEEYPENCPRCAERDEAEKKKEKEVKCSTEYLYQPYGPSVVSSLSYSRPESNKIRVYSYMGPSFYSGYRFKTPAPEMVSPIPCQDYRVPTPERVFKGVYTPYGPYAELRFTPDMYVPMGPSVLPAT